MNNEDKHNILRFWFDNLWKWKIDVNLPEEKLKKYKSMPPLESLWKSEWSEEFESLCIENKILWDKKFIKKCKEHLIIGAVRYGLLNSANKPTYDRMESILKRIKLYIINGNLEYLVDCSNLFLLEYEEGIHPNKHKGKGNFVLGTGQRCAKVPRLIMNFANMYKQTGSTLSLAYGFNLCMYEYVKGKHPKRHYSVIYD